MTRNPTPSTRILPTAILLALLALTGATAATAQPTFTKLFVPATIGPGSVSTLTFTITNAAGSPVSDLAFTDDLPAGVTIASPANATSFCGGILSAPDGGGTIDFSGGGVGPAPSACLITVDVTASTPGTHANTSGDLSSSAGTTPGPSANLLVATDRPGFTKSFAPNPIPLGARSTLTFTIDNTANPAQAVNLVFTDNLPAGIEVADPANASTDCTGGVLTAVPATTLISYIGGSVAASWSCTVVVEVIATGVGLLGNTTGELTSGLPSAVSSGKAGATLEVTVDPISLVKSFTDDPLPPGGSGTLEFTITNFDRFDAATNVAFTDDLNATLAGLAAVAPLPTNPCGAGSTLTGTSLLTLAGGNLAPEASCTFSVTLQVPGGAAAGAYVNTTSSITAEIAGDGVTGSPGEDTLFVSPAPLLTKTFIDDPVGPGQSVVIRFTITNTSPTSDATAIAFIDELTTFLPLPLSVTLPAGGFCGAGATIALVGIGPDGQGLSMTGGSLVAGTSCTFDVTLDVPAGLAAGTYVNTTEVITATVDAATVIGNPASDDLVVVAAPTLLKDFTDDPVQPGATVNLRFTLTNGPSAPGDATAITFSDDLNAALAGLAAIGLPLSDVCGAGSQLSGTTNLAFTGGTLAPGASCTFDVTLQVPAVAAAGAHTNTTSNVLATVVGVTTTENAASDDLRIAGLTFSKSFTDDPVLPGGTVNLEFTITNSHPTDGATNVGFTDDLSGVLAGLAATGLPMNDVCGAGSQISGTNLLSLTGGSVPAAGSCTFNVTLQVPPAAADDVYDNTTSVLTADVGGSPGLIIEPATDALTVTSSFLWLTKTFTDDPVVPGGTVTLEFTLTNLDGSQAATAVSFTDDLGAALTGLAAVGLPLSDVCGAGSQIAGTNVLTLTGGNLPAGGSCTFSVTLQVPAGVPLGTIVTNTTSQVTGTIGGIGVTGDPASDVLEISFLTFSKAFDGPTFPGGTPTLTFTIDNLSASASVGGLSFSDDLNAVIPGLVATGLPVSGVCGPGSQLTGTSFLTLTGGNLLPAGSCTINVPLQVPAAAAPGSYPNTTSDLLLSGLPVASPATATLVVVDPPPAFSKAFAPGTIVQGGVSTLTFTIDNTASTAAASALGFTDNLPAGVVVANPANAAITCTGGTLGAVAGTGVVSYTGGTVAAGANCTVQVDVTSVTEGSYVNTTDDLTSSLGLSGSATATLQVGRNVLLIPTLSTWALVVFALLVAVLAFRHLHMR